MDTASQILIVSGMFILAFGFALGIPMAMARDKAPRATRYLIAAHVLKSNNHQNIRTFKNGLRCGN